MPVQLPFCKFFFGSGGGTANRAMVGSVACMYARTYMYRWIYIYIYIYTYYIICITYSFTYVVSYMYTYLRHYLFVPIIIQMRRTDARLGRTDAHN